MTTMSKREAELKRKFTKALHARVPKFVVQLFASNGSPDRAITGNGVTSMWEFKHAVPRFISPGNQALTCTRLAAQGHCRYVIWLSDGADETTLIVHPRHVLKGQRDARLLDYEYAFAGFGPENLVAYVLGVHGT